MGRKKLTVPQAIGQRMRSLRHELGLSQLDMVRYYDFSLSHYQRLERGAVDPRLSTLERVAEALETTVSDLLDDIA